MKTFDFFLPTKAAGADADFEAPVFSRSQNKSAEPFDQLMNRALNKPSRDPVDKPSAAKKPATHANAPRKAKPAAHPASRPAESAAASKTDKADQAAPEDHDCSTPEAKETSRKPATKTDSTDDAPSDTPPVAVEVLPVNPPVEQEIPTAASAGTELEDSLAIAAVGAEATTVVNPNETAAMPTEGPEVVPGAGMEPKPGDKLSSKDGKKVSGPGFNPAKSAGSDEIKAALEALAGTAESVAQNPANTGDLAADKPQNPALTATGTSGAEQSGKMKHAETSAKVAGTPAPNAPDVTAVTSASQVVARSKPAVKTPARETSDQPSSVSAASALHAAPATETSSANLISASSQTEMRLRALDRTHDILALHGVQLKQSGTDSLHVVIKPGAGLQLSLQMKQTSDGIEAQALVQQGDFHDLNRHWTELQQRLEERGIRLAPLGQDPAATGGQQNFQQQSRQAPQQDALSAGAFAEFASAGAASSRPAPSAPVNPRGWESWA
ncbi:MAG: hypothetical protein U1F65_00670 [Verrucomicrobiota bacterium]